VGGGVADRFEFGHEENAEEVTTKRMETTRKGAGSEWSLPARSCGGGGQAHGLNFGRRTRGGL